MRQRFINILFWSVLSAAFIGPGTITTAASAGAGFGFELAWALLFSTLACIVLQEASSRLTLASGQNLGETIRRRFHKTIPARLLSYLVLSAILLGCAAYEAGNILGAIAGLQLVAAVDTWIAALLIGFSAALLLWFGSTQLVAQVLGAVVAVMGICFLTTAFMIGPDLAALLSGTFIPSLPRGSDLITIGLIGTTVVPYNLFLGSGLKHAQSISEMRWSLPLAIGLGGIVSIGVLIVGSSISGTFTYPALAGALEEALGGWAATFFGLGLFAAGVSSALTAPLAASVTARSFFGSDDEREWSDKGNKYRLVWFTILAIGIIFGILRVQPIPAIILAQALNGIILPFVTIFLFLVINDKNLLSAEHINSISLNVLMGIIVCVTLVLGLTNVANAVAKIVDVPLVREEIILAGSLAAAAVVLAPLLFYIKKYRNA